MDQPLAVDTRIPGRSLVGGSPPAFPPPEPVGPITRPPSRGTLAAALIGAAATDLALWTVGPGIAWTIGAGLVALAVAIGARPTSRGAQIVLAIIPLLAVWLTVRTSAWLIVPDLIAINVGLVWAAAAAHHGRWFDQSLPRALVRIVAVVADALLVLGWIAPSVRFVGAARSDETRARRRAAVAGAVIAVPLIAALAALLASADPIFASFFDVGLDSAAIGRHLIALTVGAAAVAILLRRSAAVDDVDVGETPSVPATIGNVVLGAVAAVFGLYGLSRLLALTDMAERIATTKGLTWAEYARSGFFQLLAVAAITLGVLLAVQGWSARGTASQQGLRRTLGLLIVALVIGIVIDAIHRLSGYEDAYGLTMLRLYCMVFAAWIAAVFVVVGVAYAGGYRGRRWLTASIALTALVALLVLNAANPEAVVARRNLEGSTRLGEPDLAYLADSLGDDAVPEIVDRLDALDPQRRADLVDNLCFDRSETEGWREWNTSRRTAVSALDDVCPAPAS